MPFKTWRFIMQMAVHYFLSQTESRTIRRQVESLDLLATPFGQALRALALTCDDFGRDQICTQVKVGFAPFGDPNQVNAS